MYYEGAKRLEFILRIIMILLLVVLPLLAALLTYFENDNPSFIYYGEVVTPSLIGTHNVKDPEFFRYANHSAFRDKKGYYYTIVTAHLYPAILKTRDLKTYELVAVITDLVGKVAPYVIYEPQENRLYLFYSDWLNTIQGDIRYARLGLAIGNYSEDMASIKFDDKGYLHIYASPLVSSDAGWDPYIVKINETYFLIFSLASHGVHLASAQRLGAKWKYIGTIISERCENPALFQHDGKWYMLIGMHDSGGYNLYSSENFLEWKLEKREWFKDPEHFVLPAGSTCLLINGTLYHLYQAPLSADYISGEFSLKLACITLDSNL